MREYKREKPVVVRKARKGTARVRTYEITVYDSPFYICRPSVMDGDSRYSIFTRIQYRPTIWTTLGKRVKSRCSGTTHAWI